MYGTGKLFAKYMCKKYGQKIKSKKDVYQYHLVITITDGIILQNDVKFWDEIIKSYQLELGFIFLQDPLNSFKDMIEQLKCHYSIANTKEDNAALAFNSFEVVNFFKNALETQKLKINKNSTTIIKCILPTITEKQKQFIYIDQIKHNLGLEEAIKEGNFKTINMFTT